MSPTCVPSSIAQDHHVLSHCGMGLNRSALVAGLTMHALFNERFAAFL